MILYICMALVVSSPFSDFIYLVPLSFFSWWVWLKFCQFCFLFSMNQMLVSLVFFFFFCSFYLVLWVYTSFLLLTLDLFVLLLVSLGVSIGCLLEIFLVSWGRLLLLIIISYNYFFASHSFWVIVFLIFHVSSGIFWFPLWFL